MTIKDINDKYVAGTYTRFPLTIAGGKGSVVWDETGNKYIDLGSGIAVTSFGVADDAWAAAVTKQLGTLLHTSNLYYNEPSALLAQMLCRKTGLKKVFFSNSGAEANECAIKAARKYAADKYGNNRPIIVTLKNSFHGRTITTLAATGQDEYHQDFLPQTAGFVYTPANDVPALLALVENTPNIAAFMFEVVQGEGGIVPLVPEFVDAMASIAAKKDILLICDEVQTGNGRTGKLYGYMNYGITPDIVSTAKGLAGGLPIGATLFGEKTEYTLTAGSHGSTFGGNPVCCAGALSILSRIDDALMEDVLIKTAYIVKTLSGSPGVKSISGMGLMLGIETEKPASDVITACREKGVLVIKAKNKVRLLPALNIPMELLVKAIDVIKEACAV